MRRSLAPSRLLDESGAFKGVPASAVASPSFVNSAFHSTPPPKRLRRELVKERASLKAEVAEGDQNLYSPALAKKAGAAEEHEALIAAILARQVRCPLPGWSQPYGKTGLGLRRSSVRAALFDPYEADALVLYAPPELSPEEALRQKASDRLVHVVVDPLLGKVLRPHQREGVQFMWDCVTGVKIPGSHGCIMADEMGLGKTLQCIALFWTLLRQSAEAKPTIAKGIVVCPSALVKNWDKEFRKWLGNRVNPLPMDGGKKEDIIVKLEGFMSQVGRCGTPVLIVSYETFRLYTHILHRSEVGLVICDEGHRLKNSENQTYGALMGMKCKRRVLLSGTPIQNDLLEYFSLLHFVNEGILGTAAEFKKRFENPILHGRDAGATEGQTKLGAQRTAELAAIVQRCIIRRTQALLTKYLPVKYELVLCCGLSELQRELMLRFVSSKAARAAAAAEEGSGIAVRKGAAFTAITSLKKICAHPALVHQDVMRGHEGFPDCAGLFPAGFDPKGPIRVELSGKMKVLDTLLALVKASGSGDKVVLVSNYVETLDLFVQLCNLRRYPFVRLDGDQNPKKKMKLVDKFNKAESPEWVFLLSSKAGGCGLNIVGANRLVMFDPDWNPANDDQAMARVWRDGQTKSCFVYRFLAAGTIEESIFQRQIHKKALSNTIVDSVEDAERHFSRQELRDLFRPKLTTASDTHDKIKCQRCVGGVEVRGPPAEADTASDLSFWHHAQKRLHKVGDGLVRELGETGYVSFVFHQRTSPATAERAAKEQLKQKEEEKEGLELEEPQRLSQQ